MIRLFDDNKFKTNQFIKINRYHEKEEQNNEKLTFVVVHSLRCIRCMVGDGIRPLGREYFNVYPPVVKTGSFNDSEDVAEEELNASKVYIKDKLTKILV
ncbi:hypothetical protein TNIN_86881 [Trichonephila inaurata madagascariensis]|uniref:Uncharacterized protein n=1 Tax=Trichonephila inaurata madagascariensis TaxID=2747483 RepID=A0A8X6MJ03_9ARAC|nr:hypothetical protein TNIN_86881 [Trichonephila inaurata madagascariensis]